jgi:hypothetical protein
MHRTRQKPAALPRRWPALENLEDRRALDAKGLLYGGDAHLTLSFAEDGTNIAGLESSLFSTFGALGSTEQWQEAILRAFQMWAVETNAAIGVVGDSGDDFGVPGASRGDDRFGDIRIGAAPLASGAFAIAIPASDVLSGTWVGDVIFNSNAAFSSVADVFAVALHEAGHVFGLEHSLDPLSPMHLHGITPSTTLTSLDVVQLQQLYGAPQPHFNELEKSNDTAEDATLLHINRVGSLPAGSAPSVVYGAIDSASDVDYFRIQAPAGYAGSVTLVLQTKGISLLAPRLTIVDSTGRQVEQAASISHVGDKLAVTLPSVAANGRYYAVVDSGLADVFALGDYSLVAIFNGVNAVDDATIARAANGALRFLPQNELAKLFDAAGAGNKPKFNDDRHSNDHAAAGVKLVPTAGFVLGTRYEAVGGIADASDVDFYRVEAPAVMGGVMTIHVRSLETPGLIPGVSIFDEDRQQLPVNVLVNGAGEYVVQVVGVEPGSDVTFSVEAADPTGLFNSGNYHVAVGFSDDAMTLAPAAAGSITAERPLVEHTLYVALPQLFHFALVVPPAPDVTNAGLLATILDENDQIVFHVTARPGETRTAGSVLLKPGTYRVQIAALSIEGELSGQLGYSLLAHVSSDPFVANPNDPTFEPEFECDHPGHEGLYCYPGGYVSADPFLWDDFIESLPDAPTARSLPELIDELLGDWWRYVWGQAGVNGPPLALNDAVRVSPDGESGERLSLALTAPVNVLSNDIDPEDGDVIAILYSTTSNGQLTFNSDGSFEYVPNPGFAGVDTFTYTAYDFITESAVATVRISVGLRGDYDADSDVDGSDFLEWQRNLGAVLTQPGGGSDGNGNGIVDAADQLAWQDNFGSVEALTSASPGDFDGDRDADGADLLKWQQQLGIVLPLGTEADGDGSGVVDAGDLTIWKTVFSGTALSTLTPDSMRIGSTSLVALAGTTLNVSVEPLRAPSANREAKSEPPIKIIARGMQTSEAARETGARHMSSVAIDAIVKHRQPAEAREVVKFHKTLDRAFDEIAQPSVLRGGKAKK